MDDVESTFGVFRRFPSPDDVRRARSDAEDESKVFARLVQEVADRIAWWQDPEVAPYGTVKTRNAAAARRLIDALRAEGFAADFHWHGDGETHIVQFALDRHRLVSHPRRR